MAGPASNIPYYQKTLVRTEADDSIAQGTAYVTIANYPALGAGASADLTFDSGPRISALIKLDILLREASATLQIFEDVTVTPATGTVPSEFNLNRTASAAGIDAQKTASLLQDPTITDLGTLLATWKLYGQDNGGQVGDLLEAVIDTPMQLDSNKVYLIRLTNDEAMAGDASFALQYIDRGHGGTL